MIIQIIFEKQKKKMIEFFTFFFALEDKGDLNACSNSKISSYFFQYLFSCCYISW